MSVFEGGGGGKEGVTFPGYMACCEEEGFYLL
jgi:hypothetical protein